MHSHLISLLFITFMVGFVFMVFNTFMGDTHASEAGDMSGETELAR